MTKDLNIKKSMSKIVPKNLTAWEKKRGERKVVSEFSPRLLEERDLLEIRIADETWILAYDPETRSQTLQWKNPEYPRPKNREC